MADKVTDTVPDAVADKNVGLSYLPTWLSSGKVRPFVLISEGKETLQPGLRHQLDWFENLNPIIVNPLRAEGFLFSDAARKLDGHLFASSGMEMPKWVYYDCAILPGIISGFAMKQSEMSKTILEKLSPDPDLEWVPISLFIIIPMVRRLQWMAHNLCSLNDILPEDERLRGLGFLSKAFGLWYVGVETLCGVTQWAKPAIKLHANFGFMEIVTAVTPLHTFPHSMTYRMTVDSAHWQNFFQKTSDAREFDIHFEWTKLTALPKDKISLADVQMRLEQGEGPFFLSGSEILTKPLGEPLRLFRPRVH